MPTRRHSSAVEHSRQGRGTGRYSQLAPSSLPRTRLSTRERSSVRRREEPHWKRSSPPSQRLRSSPPRQSLRPVPPSPYWLQSPAKRPRSRFHRLRWPLQANQRAGPRSAPAPGALPRSRRPRRSRAATWTTVVARVRSVYYFILDLFQHSRRGRPTLSISVHHSRASA